MSTINALKPSFVSGEITPSLAARVDLAKYSSGARLLRNMIVHPTGGVSRRPGTLLVSSTPVPANSRLIPFQFNVEQSYVLVFGVGYIWVIMSGQFVEASAGVPYAIAHTYTALEIPTVKFSQSADTLFITHKNHPPAKLTRTAHNAWTLVDISFMPTMQSPTGLAAAVANFSATGTFNRTISYMVSAISAGGEESIPVEAIDAVIKMPWTGGATVTLTWNALAAAENYSVYKNSRGYWGLIGTISKGTIPIPAGTAIESGHYGGQLPSLAFDGSSSTAGGSTWYSGSGVNGGAWIGHDLGADGTRYVSALSLTNYGGNANYSVTSVKLQSSTDGAVWVDVQTFSGLTTTAGATNNLTVTGTPAAARYWRIVANSVPVGGATHDWVVASLSFTYAGGTGSIAQTPIESSHMSIFVAANAFDGNAATYWQSGVPVSGVCWIGQDYGAGVERSVVTFSLLNYSGAGYNASSVKLQCSDDGVTWTDVQTFALSTVASALNKCDVLSEFIHYGRYWRLLANSNVSANDYNGWLVSEVKFYHIGLPTTFVDDNIQEDTSQGVKERRDPFDAAGNYPGSVALFQQRLWFSRSDSNPQTIWGSQTGNYGNMCVSHPVQDDDAIEFSMASQQVNEVRHMVPLREMLIFTSGGEWLASHGDNSDAITPTSVKIKQQSGYGCSDLCPPIVVGSSVLFVNRQGDRIRDLFYQIAQDGYDGSDLCVLAEHMFRGKKVVDWCFQRRPNCLLWVVFDDGTMASLTYMRDQEVWAWSRHDFTEPIADFTTLILSVCCISTDDTDDVYLLANNQDSSSYYVMIMVANEPSDTQVFLDKGVRLTS